ncbi:nuclear transport factor 2 family protein [Dactylosporangium sp. NPDC050688]|uniref:nuclear transport factor 2 family protein n=1 Tax=Dactylosporangium sp. NPDC050688 TaxID=3157217 RepID=UPI0033EF17E1
MSPREVFLALVHGVAEGRWEELPDLYAEHTHVVHPFDPLRAPALRTRDELREHFRPTGAGPRLHRWPDGITIHDTTDPEVIVAEFAYRGTVAGTGEPFALPGIFVLRVRDGRIVESRDYFDHVTAARIRGRLDDLVAAVRAATQPATQPAVQAAVQPAVQPAVQAAVQAGGEDSGPGSSRAVA